MDNRILEAIQSSGLNTEEIIEAIEMVKCAKKINEKEEQRIPIGAKCEICQAPYDYRCSGCCKIICKKCGANDWALCKACQIVLYGEK